jgi:hypothetical protein
MDQIGNVPQIPQRNSWGIPVIQNGEFLHSRHVKRAAASGSFYFSPARLNMASALQKKSKQTAKTGMSPVTDQTTDNHPANSDASPFTAEQRQILRNVYLLILSWRRERLMKTTPEGALVSSSILLTEREA